MTSASAQKGGVSKNTHNLKTININFADRGGQKYEEFLDVIHGSSLSLVMGRGRSGSDRRERTVRSVLTGQSVLFYHYRSGWMDADADDSHETEGVSD